MIDPDVLFGTLVLFWTMSGLFLVLSLLVVWTRRRVTRGAWELLLYAIGVGAVSVLITLAQIAGLLCETCPYWC